MRENRTPGAQYKHGSYPPKTNEMIFRLDTGSMNQRRCCWYGCQRPFFVQRHVTSYVESVLDRTISMLFNVILYHLRCHFVARLPNNKKHQKSKRSAKTQQTNFYQLNYTCITLLFTLILINVIRFPNLDQL